MVLYYLHNCVKKGSHYEEQEGHLGYFEFTMRHIQIDCSENFNFLALSSMQVNRYFLLVLAATVNPSLYEYVPMA